MKQDQRDEIIEALRDHVRDLQGTVQTAMGVIEGLLSNKEPECTRDRLVAQEAVWRERAEVWCQENSDLKETLRMVTGSQEQIVGSNATLRSELSYLRRVIEKLVAALARRSAAERRISGTLPDMETPEEERSEGVLHPPSS